MSQLKGQDIQQVVQLFENELGMLPRVNRTDKMKLRKKILNSLTPLLNEPDITAQAIIQRLESRLEDVLALFIDRNLFKAKLTSLLREKLG
jgi:uncharacterized protein HemX